MNRIDEKFSELKRNNKKAFIAFITVGDPNLEDTEKLVYSFEKAGVDIVELGVPFSDPVADGPTIQASSQRALDNKVNLDKVFKLVKRIRKISEIPIALMMYYNPIFHYGEASFIGKAKKSGVDGLVIPDLPPEEAHDLRAYADENEISTIFFIAPTTTPERMKKIVKASTGFIYYISLTGVTGARKQLTHSFSKLKDIQKLTDKPICVGFGISTAQQVKEISKLADGVIVGSAIINTINMNAKKRTMVKIVTKYVVSLTKVLN